MDALKTKAKPPARPRKGGKATSSGGIEANFDVGFISRLTSEEKQIQQNYRPIIGVHKWFARRPGSLFRGLLLSEFASETPLAGAYFRSHDLTGKTVLDPFMGGGSTLFEANRLGCNAIGLDINPLAYWIVRQELSPLDLDRFRQAALEVAADVEAETGDLYVTACVECGAAATVKYFLWVKQQRCASCNADLDLFPGYLIAGNERHTHFVLHCPHCVQLVQVKSLPDQGRNVKCPKCSRTFCWSQGSAVRNRYLCGCGHAGRYPAELRRHGHPRHRLFGIEYHCFSCRSRHQGRWFKTADREDLVRHERAVTLQRGRPDLPCPDDSIPDGDETKRLHRWGYARYREMFDPRQLLTLGLLASRIRRVQEREPRWALATVFSDMLRYQNMLCRYDTYALKCQDIFAVHGFPVGLLQCENNVLGTPGVGGGGFRHFVEKYARAKAYCTSPFETIKTGKSTKQVVHIRGERIEAEFVKSPSELGLRRQAFLAARSVDTIALKSNSVDAVFTDPPYFDNVQYAELMDFCFCWIRTILGEEVPEFRPRSTRCGEELTGNVTLGKDLSHFTRGLSRIFRASARALKPGAPFVFTYHHNDIAAYVPIIVAILDAKLICTATLPAPAEMTASLHISGTASSVVDSIVVCRKPGRRPLRTAAAAGDLAAWLEADRDRLKAGGIRCTEGDYRCIALGHLARVAIFRLHPSWKRSASIESRSASARSALESLVAECGLDRVVAELAKPTLGTAAPPAREAIQARVFD